MTLTTALFEPHVGGEITVHLDDGTLFTLTLDKVTASGGSATGTDEQSAFMLDLTGPSDTVLPPLTYPVSASGLSTTHLFISAHAQDAAGTYYNIVVN